MYKLSSGEFDFNESTKAVLIVEDSLIRVVLNYSDLLASLTFEDFIFGKIFDRSVFVVPVQEGVMSIRFEDSTKDFIVSVDDITQIDGEVYQSIMEKLSSTENGKLVGLKLTD